MIVPDAIEPIVAWRYWSLNDAGRLRSPLQVADTAWLPGQRMEAECALVEMFRAWEQCAAELGLQESSEHQGPLERRLALEDPACVEHEAPLEDCSCGIHAAKDLDTLRRELGSGTVVGEVYLWGKVIPGENGYRAQYAYPKSLRLVTKCVLDDELDPLRAYCEDVGVMAPSEAWSPWWRRALSIVDMVTETREGVAAIVFAIAALQAVLD